MANYTTTANVVVSVNGQQAKKMLSDLETQAKSLRQKMDEATNAGDTKKLQRLTREYKQVQKAVTDIKMATQGVNEVMKNLDKASPVQLEKALKRVRTELRGMAQDNPKRAELLAQFQTLKGRIDQVNASLRTQQTLWQRITSVMSGWTGSMLGATAAITGFLALGKKSVNTFAEMEEAMANTMKFTGMTAEAVADLNEEFKKMDTRTARETLNELAQEAGRLGKTSKEDIMGYVKAADILNVALSDLGDGATQKIAKLTNIFGVEETEGTYNAMVKIGSVINVLSQNSTASKPYLVEFANRLAGVGNMAKMSIQEIVGLGAVLDANAQKVEASSTAIGQVLTRMYRDPAKYARVAGLDVQQFTDLLKTNANEALLQFLETLSKAGNMDVLAPMFKDMGENGARAIQAMSTLAKHIDEVRWQQGNANKAFEEGTSVLREYNIFNNTVKAALEKAKKEITELTDQLGEKLYPVMKSFLAGGKLTLQVLIALVGFISSNWKSIVTLTAAIVAYNVAVNLATIRTQAFAAAQGIANAGMKLMQSLVLLGNAAIALFSGNITRATAAFKLFSAAIKANPVGLLVSAVTAAVSALLLFRDKGKEARKEMENFSKEIRKIDNTAAEYAKNEVARLDTLYKVATDEKKSMDARINAVKELQKLKPETFAQLETEAILTGKVKEQYDQLRDSIIGAARASAAREKIAENSAKLLELEAESKQLQEEERQLMAQRQRDLADYQAMQESNINATSGSGYNAIYGVSALSETDKALKKNRESQKLNAAQTNELTKANDELYDSYVKVSSAMSSAPEDTPLDDTQDPYVRPLSDKEQERQRKAAAKKARQDYKAGLEAIKAEELRTMTELEGLYQSGQINYLDFVDGKRKAEAKFYDDSLSFMEHYLSDIKGLNLEEDADYQNFQKKKLEADQKYESQRIAYSAEAIRRISNYEQREIENKYKWKENFSVLDEIAMQDELLEIRIKYLKQEQELHVKGTKEWVDLQLKIESTAEDARLEREQLFQKTVSNLQKKFSKATAQELYEANKQALDFLLEQGKITLDMYEKLLEQMGIELDKELKSQRSSLPGAPKTQSAKNQNALSTYDGGIKKLKDALNQGIISEEEFKERSQSLKDEMVDAWTEGLRNCSDEWVSALAAMGTAWYKLFDGITSGDTVEKISAVMAATAAVIGAAMSSMTQFVQAEMEIQTAAIEKRYDAEIERAEGNTYRTKKLEKQKEEEIAKVKNEANKKMFAMQVIQAVAQTATSALNAYSSAAAIPVVGWVMAPIAAAMAVAAGMVQIASIKKQQQASQAQGYSEGGFTPSGDKDEPVGIVHAGEWVASQKLVNNPRTRPLLEALDYAQRNNTIGSITAGDVSRSITAPMVLASSPEAGQPNVIVNVPENNSGNSELNQTLSQLNQRLNEPFVTINTVSGDYGTEQAQQKYDRLMKNKSPKTKK